MSRVTQEEFENHYELRPVKVTDRHMHRCTGCGRSFVHDGPTTPPTRNAEGKVTDQTYITAHTCAGCNIYCGPIVQPPLASLPLGEWRKVDELYWSLPVAERLASNSITLYRHHLTLEAVKRFAPKQEEPAVVALRRLVRQAQENVENTTMFLAIVGMMSNLFISTLIHGNRATELVWDLMRARTALRYFGTFEVSQADG